MEEGMTEVTHLKHFYCRLCTISGTTGHHPVLIILGSSKRLRSRRIRQAAEWTGTETRPFDGIFRGAFCVGAFSIVDVSVLSTARDNM